MIRAARMRSGKSLSEVADNIGKSEPYLSRIERGLRAPENHEVWVAMAQAVGLRPVEVLAAAGLVDIAAESRRVTVPAAVEADPNLTRKQRAILVDLYRSWVPARAEHGDR